MTLKSHKPDSKRAYKIGKFPDALFNYQKLFDFDAWFKETWKRKGAINIPTRFKLEKAAVRLSRATVRKAWWDASEATKAFIRPSQLELLKEYYEKVRLMENEFGKFQKWLARIGPIHSSSGAEIIGSNIHWLRDIHPDGTKEVIGGVLAEAEDGKIADSLNSTLSFLQNTTKQMAQRIKGLSAYGQHVGRPELTAFALPFVEAKFFMAGKGLAADNIALRKCLTNAWAKFCDTSHENWDHQIKAALEILTRDQKKMIADHGPSYSLHDCAFEKLFEGETPRQYFFGVSP